MEYRGNWAAAAVLGLAIAIGLAVAGFFVSTTLYKGRLASNTVTVKGFAERDVKADLALWTITETITGGDVAKLYAQADRDQKVLVGFLQQKGFTSQQIKAGVLQINDVFSNEFRAKDANPAERYILKNTITVRSNGVALVDQATRSLNDLVKQGIVLTANDVDFQFTKLNDIKASMLRDATQNARDAAEQFAKDAGSTVGSIQTANQGFFSINSRDSAAAQNPEGGNDYTPQKSTIDKKVRVVVTLTYYLER